MKQGQMVKWTDGMGFEHEGIVDWDAIIWHESRIPIRCKEGNVVRIERRNIEEINNSLSQS